MKDTCKDCTSNCCKVGLGQPYKIVSPKKYLQVWGEVESYNIQCDGLTNDNKCSYWGSSKHPLECRTYICHSRTFTFNEIEIIRKLKLAR